MSNLKDAIRAQVCENGHRCRCEFDDSDPTVSMQLSGNCCVHGEVDCSEKERIGK